MKKLNNKGVSLGETMAAITVLGIVLGVALTVVNSRAKQLDLINTEMVTMFKLNDESNRFYLSTKQASDTPSHINDSESYHLIQKGSELKTNPKIDEKIRKELNENPNIDNDQEYLLSYTSKNGRYYHMLRLSTNEDGGANHNIFISSTDSHQDPVNPIEPNVDDKVPPIKPNSPVDINESEINMPFVRTSNIVESLNLRFSNILKTPEPTPELLTEENKYNESIFTKKENTNKEQDYQNQIPIAVTIAEDPLALQVKLYNRNYYENSTAVDIEYKEINFFALLKAEFKVQSKTYYDYIKVYGAFNADYNPTSNKFIITTSIKDLDNSNLKNRFWNEPQYWKNINIESNPLLEHTDYATTIKNANLIKDSIGYIIMDYIQEEISAGDNLYSGGIQNEKAK